jgi:hypothetical protein
MKNISIYILFVLVLSISAKAQVPTPAPAQQKPVMITGATVHVGNGQTVENGTLAFENGKLTYVGPDHLRQRINQNLKLSMLLENIFIPALSFPILSLGWKKYPPYVPP